MFGENEAATSDGGVSEAPWDTAETSVHITESGGEGEMTTGESVYSVRLAQSIFVAECLFISISCSAFLKRLGSVIVFVI